MHLRQLRLGFATQDCVASKSVVATSRNGEGDVRVQGHNARHLSLLV